MAIVEHASAPAVATGTGTGNLTTASFSPPAGSLLLAMVVGGFGTTSPDTDVSISDNVGGTWSIGAKAKGISSGQYGVSAVFFRYLPSAPGAMTVTASYTRLGAGRYLRILVLTGANPDQSAAIATAATSMSNSSTTTASLSVNRTTAGSRVYGISGNTESTSTTSFTANGNTTALAAAHYNGTDDIVVSAWKANADTVTPGAVTLGGTWSTAGQGRTNIAAFEVLPEPTGPTKTPAEVLNIGAAAGKNHFAVQVARNGDADALIKTQAEIAAGYTEDPYFRTRNDDSAVQFSARVDAPRVGASDFSRSELREVRQSGTNAAFDPFVGTHTMHGRTRITSVPSVTQAVLIAQLHNGTTDRMCIRTQLVSGTLRLRARINGSSITTSLGADLLNGSANIIGVEFEWKLVVSAGAWQLYFNNMTTPVASSTDAGAPQLSPTGTGDAGKTWYFKAGLYNQSNAAGEQTDYGTAELRDFIVTHSAPTTTLTDDFDDNTIDLDRWPDSFGGARLSEADGRARVDVTDGTGNGVSAGYGSAAGYTLAGSEAFVQCSPPDLLPGAESCFGRLIYYANPGVSYNTYAAWHADRFFGMYSQVVVGGVVQDNTIVDDYDLVAHGWIKLRETAGTLYFEVSPNGRPGTWTTLRTWTTPTEIGSASTGEIAIEAGTDTTDATTNHAEFDNFNIEPPAPTAPAGQFMPFFI